MSYPARCLNIINYLDLWNVKYLKHNAINWSLHSLKLKTHGRVSYQDITFITAADALNYAKEIAQHMNSIYNTNIGIVVNNKLIETITNSTDLNEGMLNDNMSDAEEELSRLRGMRETNIGTAILT